MVLVLRCSAPTGAPADYVAMWPKNVGTGVLPLHDDGTVTLVGQHRFTLMRYSWEMPEGGAPFVARRAMNLHGCALPHCAPRSSYCGGTPGSAFLTGVGRPPSCGDSAVRH